MPQRGTGALANPKEAVRSPDDRRPRDPQLTDDIEHVAFLGAWCSWAPAIVVMMLLLLVLF